MLTALNVFLTLTIRNSLKKAFFFFFTKQGRDMSSNHSCVS